MSYKVVFHIDWDDDQILKMALVNIENLLKDPSAISSKIHLVANGESVRFFRKEFCGENYPKIKELHSNGVRFCICNNSLNKLKYKPENMLDICEIVPTGVIEICRLQDAGFAYIKP
ncbi:hypothetical protein SAMN05660337_2408 [Maridesulfovibrio ferrireducens]|uniref:Uncharacterized protein n=1 Tax=Maridesulfovibrio ferrireducens TaxID=246191 RepID=A0A1G9I1I5_9BACT|nr:DsrE family protein [Maridesulfovibrio ferrireducens]SDL19069.1 hypothetical protein SAMN05660337_2408 [Maridesulfovibrio ferrireducens]